MADFSAHYHRCDFQVHSPRDERWVGPKPVSDEDRLGYAKSLVAACRDKGIHAIAITDHHDMTFIPYVREAAVLEKRPDGSNISDKERLIIFPGMELTLGVPCQALIIFDANFPNDMFSLALAALAITPSEKEEKSTAAVQRLDRIHSLQSLKDKLDEHQYLRGKYIVLPNVSDSGTATLLRKGNHGKYVEMPWVGGYVDGSIERLGRGNKDIIAGRSLAHGNKKIAVVQTSDSRRSDHKELGEHSTWVKWSTPTAEALRQAFLAQESRVSHVEPVLPQRIIESISVNNSKFLGPIDIDLSRQYNALIGGRGTGKSTILEYLRWGMCDQPPTGVADDTPRYERRRDQLIADTLKPFQSKVDIKFSINGVPHHARRESETGRVLLKVGNEDFRQCSEAELRAILPIQSYSQKQLSDVSVRLDELLRFITTPVQDELETNKRQLGQTGDKIRALYANKLRKRGVEREIQQGNLLISSLRQQISSLKESLPGLSPKDQEIMQKSQLYAAAEQSAASWDRSINEIGGIALDLNNKIIEAVRKAEFVCEHKDLQVVSRMCGKLQSFLRSAKERTDSIIVDASNMVVVSDGKDENPWQEWAANLKQYRQAYTEAVTKGSANAEKLQQIARLEQRLSTAGGEIAAYQETMAKLETAEVEFNVERNRWKDLLRQRVDMLKSECEKLTAASDGIIKAEVRPASSATAFSEKLREAAQGSGIQRSKLDSLVERMLADPDSQNFLEMLLDDLESLAVFDSNQQGNEQLPDTPHLIRCGLTPNELRKIANTINSDRWLQLMLTPLETVPEFQYRSREGEYIPFKNASAGQQATALLKTLLNQEGPPLIIDQPEEDLDNPVILEIVAQIWAAKARRQIIFASHNANLVVNGDAELVIWCDYRTSGDQSGGKIAGQGAIDIPSIKVAIKNVMEGGDDAFNLRMQKYGF